MRKIVCCILGMLLVLALAVSALASAYPNGTIHAAIIEGPLEMVLAVTNGNNESFKFMASIDDCEMTEVTAEPYNESQGHIVVVDASCYYGKTPHITAAHLQQIVSAYLSSIPNQDQVMFIIATGSECRTTNFMNKASAQNYVTAIEMDKSSESARIYEAIRKAFEIAADPTDGGPYFKTVFALVDPATYGNTGYQAELNNATTLRSETWPFPVTIASIYQASFMEVYLTPEADKTKAGWQMYASFAEANDTNLISIRHERNEDINVSNLYALFGMDSGLRYYSLDLEALHPFIDYSNNKHKLTITANGVKNSYGEINMELLSTVLPEPIITPTPEPELPTEAPPTVEPTETPTPTPEPTPVAIDGSNSNEARQAIRKLKQLGYLETVTASFDETCSYAFMEFCEVNGIEINSYIDNDAFALLMSDQALPKPTPTPTPVPTEAPTATPTPVPTEAPMVMQGSSDTNAMRAIRRLCELYYLSGERSQYKEFDSVCVQAFMDFCDDNKLEPKNSIDALAWDVLMAASTKPKATATPEPVVTATPAPTIRPEGYTRGDTDAQYGGDYISSMQNILEKLNLFTSPKTIGVVDDATMEAVALYCETYQQVNNKQNGISYSTISDILNNGASRTPYTPPVPTTSENLRNFLQKTMLELGSFQVKAWMLLLLAVVLIFVLIIVIIVSVSKNKAAENSGISVYPPHSPPVPGSSENTSTPTGNGGNRNTTNTGNPTRPVDNDETLPGPGNNWGGIDTNATMPLSAGINVTLNITGGRSAGIRNELLTNKNYVVGRASNCDLRLEDDRTVSREHIALSYRDNQVIVYNTSATNPARVNGQEMVAVNNKVSENDETMVLGAALKNQNDNARTLRSGDEISLGNYRIVITW